MLGLRNKTRYGRFSAKSNIGKVIVEIYVVGWFDGMKVIKDGNVLLEGVVTEFPDNPIFSFGEAMWEESNYGFLACQAIAYKGELKWLSVKKPLGKCLKRFD